MKNVDQYKRIITYFAALVILSMQTALYWVVWDHYYSTIIKEPFFRRGNWIMVLIYMLLLLFFGKTYGGYKIGYYKKTDIAFSQILGVLFVNGITYLQISLLGLRIMNIIPILIMTGLDIVIVLLWTQISGLIFKKIYPPHKMILLYGERSADALIHKMNQRKDKYHICATMNINQGMEAIKKNICNYDAVIIWDIPAQVRNEIMKYCFGQSIRTYIMPKISDIIVMGAGNINLFDTPLLLSRNCGLTFDQRIAKRVLDVLLASIALVLSAPFMLLTAAAIKIYDHGPVFYKQERLTVNSNLFYIYKFRSMIVDAEKDGVARLAGQNDNRITPIGKFIRAIRFDELPQILNILKGDMSIVGPRPERPEIAKQYMKEMPEFEYRLKVKAGLTGYAQVFGKYNTTPYDKLKLDLSYIENYSFMMDIKLIIITFKILFKKESTEGIKEGQNTALRNNGIPEILLNSFEEISITNYER